MFRLPILLGVILVVSACVGNEQAVRRCCYQGKAAVAKLADIDLVLKDGARIPFHEVLSAQGETAVFNPSFPTDSLDLDEITDTDVASRMRRYDANEDDLLQGPELALMYIREIALGLGYEVTALFADSTIRAVHVSSSDIGRLAHFVQNNQRRLAKPSRDIFAEVERQAFYQELDRSGDQEASPLFLN